MTRGSHIGDRTGYVWSTITFVRFALSEVQAEARGEWQEVRETHRVNF